MLAGLLTGCRGPLTPDRDRDASILFGRAPSVNVAAELARSVRNPDGDGSRTRGRPPSLAAPAEVELADLIVYGLDHHPSTVAAVQAWRRAVGRIGVAGLPDAALSVQQARDELASQQEAKAARDFERDVPWPGTVAEEAAAWGPAIRATWYRLVMARLDVARGVRSVVHELAGIDATVALLGPMLLEFEALDRVARERSAAAGDQAALDEARRDLQDRRRAATAMRPIVRATLNGSLGRPGNAPLPGIAPLAALVATPPASTLVADALATNPTLLVLDDRREEERISAAVARARLLPRLTLGVQGVFTGEPQDAATPMNADEPVMVTLGVSFPLWSRRESAGLRGMISRRLTITDELESARRDIARDVREACLAHLEAAERAATIETSLAPAARRDWERARDAYYAGRGTLPEAMAVHRTRLELELALVRARVERGLTLARLEARLGRSVTTRLAGS